MKSIKTVYKVGNGPSSSHTVGPYGAAKLFKSRYPEADAFEVTLFGSLAFTGEGHGTGKAILSAIPEAKLSFDFDTEDIPHPNTMDFKAFKGGELLGENRIMSIGGGSIRIEGEESEDDIEMYKENNFTEIMASCKKQGYTLSEFIYNTEGYYLKDYLREIWHEMEACVERGLETEGILPGGLDLTRKAKMLYDMRCHNESSDITMDRTLAAYAFAASEENAAENVVVTAPTCGSAGVIPALFYYMRHDKGYTENEIIDALAVAAIIGNVIRTNASVSGAECGCQAEIGSACCMAAGALASMYGMSIEQVEYAAEVAMEHHLGLTCDPVGGLVQIPCIERNSVAAMRAVNAVNISRFMYETRRISLDQVIATMYETGLDLNSKYRETAHGGLAAIYDWKK